MPVTDSFGYALTLDQSAALAPWSRTVKAFLAHSAEAPIHLTATLNADPEFPLAHCVKGYFLLLLGRRELIAAARDSYEKARARSGELTNRERAYLEGLGDYLEGNMRIAADRLDTMLIRYPRDTLLLKLAHALRFVLGDAAGMRGSIEAVISAHGVEHPLCGYVNGCYAFALEETGEYLAAERRGRDALILAPDDAWGLHAVAHVYDMTNRSTEGVAWISGQPDAWTHCNNFGYHVWWHLALFHLDRGEHARVLELYDEKIRADKSDDYRDISNASSLLMRLEIDGVDIGDRWEELAALSETRTDDGCVVFADLHYMLALCQSGRADAAARLLSTLRTAGERRIACMDKVAAKAGAPAAQGLKLFSEGDYAGAYARLAQARPHMQIIGGSHAQRDVFERLTIEAALRAGRLAEARATLQHRIAKRGALDRYAETRLNRIRELDEASGAVVAAE